MLPRSLLSLTCVWAPAESTQPEDWDTEEDGEWEAPSIPNPKCKDAPGCGPWTRPQKPNPAYKGKWSAPLIDNPEYKARTPLSTAWVDQLESYPALCPAYMGRKNAPLIDTRSIPCMAGTGI